MSNSASGGGSSLPLVQGGDAPTPNSAGASPSPYPSASTATIRIEGQEFELERALADDDKTLRSVLRPHYAALENALITREDKADGRHVVTIVKRAQHKGGGGDAGREAENKRPAEYELLAAEPETFNPALALAAKLGQRSFDSPLTEPEIEDATAVLDLSQSEIARMERWQKNLSATAPSASPTVPAGF